MSIDWLTLERAREQLAPAQYTQLADDGSLTRRVRMACNGEFAVKPIDHTTVELALQDSSLLGLPERSEALSRRVFLCCDDLPLIYARTLIGLTRANRVLTDRIQQLGSQSLGSLLFRDPLASKQSMWLACVSTGHVFFEGVDMSGIDDQSVWVRRSLYEYEGFELIVYEAFIRFLE